MKWLKSRLRVWLGMPELEARLAVAEAEASRAWLAFQNKVEELNYLTREDWDIGARGHSTIILTGVYRGRGYVKFYDVPAEEFNYLVERFRSQARDHLIRNVDEPYLTSGAFDMRKGRRTRSMRA